MKQKIKGAYKHLSIVLLTLVLSVFAVSGADGLGKVYAGTSFDAATEVADGDTCEYEKYIDVASYYKVIVEKKSFLQFINTNSINTEKGDDIVIVLYNEGKDEIKTFTQDDVVMQRTNTFAYTTDNLDEGTYYFSVARKPGLSGPSAGKNSGKVKLTVTPVASNTDSNGAEVIDMPVTGTVERTWKDAMIGTAHRKMYYTLNVTDKAYYDFRDSSSTIALYKGTTEEYANQFATTSELNYGEHLLEVGKYLLVGYGTSEGKEYNVKIKCRDFIDIKSISGQDYYETYQGYKLPISVSFDPAVNESSVKWTSANQDVANFTNYDYESKTTLEDKTKAYIYAKGLGVQTGTITTSEGVSKTIKVMIKPRPVKVKEATANTTGKKKATLTISWDESGGYYKVYEKSGNDYKLVKETTATTLTFSKVPGKTYNYMIEACYKAGNEIICSSKGEGVDVITAPYLKPTVKSAKQVGKTQYTKPYTKSYRHWNGHYYYWETMKCGNTSTATIKLKIKKAKGAKSYETGKGYKIMGNKVTYSYSGKIKGKTEKLKIRGVWENAVTKAYGPWSKTKKIKIKGNK